MFFSVINQTRRFSTTTNLRAFLITDAWDDWFKFSTQYSLVIFDAAGIKHDIGGVKIGQFSMEKDQRRPNTPDAFDELDDQFFSIGQDDSYYEKLNELGTEMRDRVLTGLRDMAVNLELFDRAVGEKVTGTSLLRSVTPATVRGQFHRLARGGVRLSRFEFEYSAPKLHTTHPAPVVLKFTVEPESHPPTNIHVLIGRNGVGKTHLLNNMTRAVVGDSTDAKEVGSFLSTQEDQQDGHSFASLVSVTFSAFDPFYPLPNRQDKSRGVQYAYVGLKRVGMTEDGKPLPPKSPEKLASEFVASIMICRSGARVSRWRDALRTLESDRNFRDAEVSSLADEVLEEEESKAKARKLFGKLSSGHKIVLLTITRLVETVEERTLVLIDEPEAHLHPPLLSAFIRALSDLLINRNGVAIIATHSPVILQEVPSCCTWKVRRNGYKVVAERPEIETFGENTGVLTREVFGLEVARSGFHSLLREAVESGADYEAIVQKFDGKLGGEARAILRGLISARDAESEQ